MNEKTFDLDSIPTTKTKGGILLISRPPIVVHPVSTGETVETFRGSRIIQPTGMEQLPKIKADQ